MRDLRQFSLPEWLKLVPLAQALRQLRNDALLSLYEKKRPPELDEFLAQNAHLSGKDIALVIAFEQPWALDWLLEMTRAHLPEVALLVLDNSRSPQAREEINQVCRRRGVAYLALPSYKTRHVNRSHGMAMSWTYANVVDALKPRHFGFLDHDLIPVRGTDLSAKLRDQPVFGLINAGNLCHWSLWAGYCFFRYSATQNRSLNFLYDFSRGLDTGGRNWNTLYRGLNRQDLRFASRQIVEVRLPAGGESHDVEFIDGAWIHIGGISYTDSLKSRFEFFGGLRQALAQGLSWGQMAVRTKEAAPGR